MAILHPLAVPPVNPKTRYEIAASVASGASTVLETLQVAANKKASLMGLIVTSSIPFKAEVYTVSDGVQGYMKAMWYAHDGAWQFIPPSPEFITVQGENYSQIGFRIVVTNLGIDTADICAFFYYDEE